MCKITIKFILFLTSLMVSVTHAGIFYSDDVDVNVYASQQQLSTEAAKFKPEKWKIPLGQHVIEQMLVIDGELAIAGLKNYNNGLKKDQIRGLDLKAGTELWLFDIDENAIEANIVVASIKYILLEIVFNDKTQLISLDSYTGQQQWKKHLPEKGQYRIQQQDRDYFILALRTGEDINYQYFDIKTGTQRWSYSSINNGTYIPKTILYKKGLIIPGASLVSLNVKTGRVNWRHKKISYEGIFIQPVINHKDLYIVSSDYFLYRIDLPSGKVVWKFKSANRYNITSIDPGKSLVYLRGMIESVFKNRPIVIAVNKQRGRIKWQISVDDKDQLISNFIEYEGMLFGASPSTLYAFKQKTGKVKYKRKVSKSQLSLYPVVLRRVKANIVFIGELNIAGYRASSGARVFKKGITGISPAADLSALEKSIKRLTNKADRKQGRQSVKNSTVFSQQYAVTQASSNSHYNNYTQSKWMGDYSTASTEYMSSRIDNSFAKAYSGMAAFEATQNLSSFIYDALVDELDKNTLSSHKLIRNSILSSYPAMMSENYVYRPSRSLNLTEPDAGEYLQITTIDIRSGRRKRTSMSVPFKEYGLWIYVDEEKNIAYQQSLGMDYKGEEPPISYLIAKPILMPK